MQNQRKKIVAGNWKMHKTFEEGLELAGQIVSGFEGDKGVEVVLAPPFIHQKAVGELLATVEGMSLAGQNCHQEAYGAYTGEVSAEMLRSVGARYVILGHSERRQYFGEDDELLRAKVDRALEAGLDIIFCCGESLEVREGGDFLSFVSKQVEAALFHLEESSMARVVLAYEPIWAIGTGRTASPEQAQEMHAHLRKKLGERYGEAFAERQTILYGGSCKPTNAKELFSQPDVDGGLIGGASLVAEDFLSICRSF